MPFAGTQAIQFGGSSTRRTIRLNAECSSNQPAYLLTANAIFCREALLEGGGFDPRLRWCEDLELGWRLSRAGAAFGYAPDAAVEIDAPPNDLEFFAQFYKCNGVGLDGVQELHNEMVGHDPSGDFLEILALGRTALRTLSQGRLMFLMRSAYLAGWIDARLRRRILRARRRPDRLPVRRRCRPRGDAGREFALSIDDGPSAVTPALLSLLERYSAKATFFVIGERIASCSEHLAPILRAGHEIYAHGWSHRRFDCLSTREIADEMERLEAALRRWRPTPSPYLVRLPYGAGAEDPHVHRALRRWNADCEIVQWTLSLEDWRLAQASGAGAEVASRRAVERLLTDAELPGSIVLLHDMPVGVESGPAEAMSVLALRDVLHEAACRGTLLRRD